MCARRVGWSEADDELAERGDDRRAEAGRPPGRILVPGTWWWGPGNPHATTVVAVMPGPVDGTGGGTGGGAYLRQFFTSVRAVATLSNPYRIHNQEWDSHGYLCTGPRHPWAQMRPRLRNYD